MIVTMLLIGGCRSTRPADAPVVTKAARYSEAAIEHFAEGDTADAIRAFRKAIYRSWETDDAYQAGSNAYNLAAALFDSGDHEGALDWLVDARVELARAGASAGNTYLLEAKIAQQEGRFDDARRLIALADCTSPPCHEDEDDRNCADACRPPRLACLPCLGNRLVEKQAAEQCRRDYQAQVHLARARLAADQYELSRASKELTIACEFAQDVCSDDLRAEIQHAAAMIDLAQGRYIRAAAHLDRQVLLLRRARNYREIPEILSLSAATYQQAARFELAADRWCRAARVWLARGELDKSWESLRKAADACPSDDDYTTSVRWRLTAREIEAAAMESGQPIDSKDQQELDLQSPDQGMLPEASAAE